jgi:hypothetical protein
MPVIAVSGFIFRSVKFFNRVCFRDKSRPCGGAHETKPIGLSNAGIRRPNTVRDFLSGAMSPRGDWRSLPEIVDEILGRGCLSEIIH